MMKRVSCILLAVVGIVGAGASIAMLISAIAFSEWGRVVLYCVTLAICVELAVLNILKLTAGKTDK